MHARVSTFSGSPERFDEEVRVANEQVVPKARTLPGFMGGYWLGDRQSGRGKAVLFYSSAETLRESTAAAQQVRQEASQAAQVKIDSVDEFEVVFDTGQKIHHDAGACRVVNVKGDPSDIDRLAARIRDDVLPILRGISGFQGGVWLADRSTGKGVGITLFDTLDSVTASRDQAKQIVQGTLQQLNLELGGIEEMEITARAEAPAGVPGS